MKQIPDARAAAHIVCWRMLAHAPLAYARMLTYAPLTYEARAAAHIEPGRDSASTQFTRFTSTKVQILTHATRAEARGAAHIVC
jgi:hypothetical protein